MHQNASRTSAVQCSKSYNSLQSTVYSTVCLCVGAQHLRPAACWINDAGALRIVYALPILLALLANAFFFTRTVCSSFHFTPLILQSYEKSTSTSFAPYVIRSYDLIGLDRWTPRDDELTRTD